MEKFNDKLNAIKEAFYIDELNPVDFKKKFSEGLVVKMSSPKFCLFAKSYESFKLRNEIINEIYEDNYLFDNYSLQEIHKAVMADIFDVLQGIKSDYLFFKELFLKSPIKHLIVRSISGIKIQNVTKLGNYYFFYNKNDLARKGGEIQKREIEPDSFPNLFPGLQYPCVGTIVASVGEEKAREKADISFQQFENIMQFMIGERWNEFYLKIVSRDVLMKEEDICINQKTTGSKFSLKGPWNSEVCIDNPYFSNSENTMIWQLLEKESRLDWEEKILRSINWIGKGLRNEDITMSFLQMLFSLESLFVVDAPLFLSESITSKMADSVAYVLSDEMKERVEITKKMKKIYDLRSKVVHSGKESISLKDANKLFFICESVLMSFLKKDVLKAIKSNADLLSWFNFKKYS